MKATFPKHERLCRKTDFNMVFSKGNAFIHFPVKTYFLFSHSVNPDIKVAFSVPTKRLKKAVDRNYIKRIFREVYRKNKFLLYEILNQYSIRLVFVYVANEKITYAKLEQEFKIILQKIKEYYLTHETNT